MAKRVRWWAGEWFEKSAINRNAEELEHVEANVGELQKTVARQAREIVQLRATILGVVEVLHGKIAFDDTELESAVNEALGRLAPPPPAPKAAPTDPYRGLAPASDASAEDVAAAKALLRAAEDHHFAKRFAEARAAYQEIVDKYGGTKQAAVARQQIENLRGS